MVTAPTTRLIPADAATYKELHAKHPYLSIRWLRDLRTFTRVDSWKPLKEVLLSESEVIAYASGRGYSPAGQQAA
jgi:hypothetical protein